MSNSLNALLGVPYLNLCDIWLNHYPSHVADHTKGINYAVDISAKSFLKSFIGINFPYDCLVFRDDNFSNSKIVRSLESITSVQKDLESNQHILNQFANCVFEFLKQNGYPHEETLHKATELLKTYETTLDLTPIIIFTLSLPLDTRRFLQRKIHRAFL